MNETFNIIKQLDSFFFEKKNPYDTYPYPINELSIGSS